MTRHKDDAAAVMASKQSSNEDGNPEKMRFINGSDEIYPSVKKLQKDAAPKFSGLSKAELMAFADDPYWVKIRSVFLIIFWVIWFGMLLTAILIIVFTPGCPKEPEMTWLQQAKVYQILPRSFLDTNQDGIGDIKGIIEKLDYLQQDLNITALWVNPLYPSDMSNHAGYSVINHTAIDEIYGSMGDLEAFVKELHKRSMKLILDFVPNHTSKKHRWFQESRKSRDNSYANFYVWHPGSLIGTVRQPPNNWRSVHGGSAWTYDNTRKSFYLHHFLPDQPDLNLRSKEVIAELQKILEFWLEKKVDAFHIANVDYLFESRVLTQNEVIVNVTVNNTEAYGDMFHNLTKYQIDTFKLVGQWSKFVHSRRTDKYEPYLILETDGNEDVLLQYQKFSDKAGIHIKINQALIDISADCLGRCIYKTITSTIGHEKAALWPMWMIGDKYDSRVATRVGSEYVNAMNMLLLTMRGTPITYYGEEIGMIDLNLTSVNTSDYDLFGGAAQLSKQQLIYDQSRSPMQWTPLKHAGFTVGRRPWCPVGSNYLTANVRTQKAHGVGVSHLEVYHVLSSLRTEPAIRFGKFSTIGLHESVFCFVRHAPRFKSYLVAINFGPDEATLDFFVASPGLVQKTGRVVATTHNFEVPGEFAVGSEISLANVYLRPTEGLVIQMASRER